MSVTRRGFVGGGIAIAAAGGIDPLHALAACVPGNSRLALRGVSLAGAEFGERMPGVHGKDYIYPGAAEVNEIARLGFNSVRLPFRWERLVPEVGGRFDEQEWRRLAGTISFAERAGLRVILDVHNYAGRKVPADGFSVEHKIGSSRVPAAAFVDFCGELAARCKAWPNLILGLINEPAGIAPAVWLGIANGAIARVRAVGSRHLILVPGIAYTGAHSWYASGNVAMAGIVDPRDNFAIEVHQYLDADSSGTSAEVVGTTIGSERIEAFQEWARARGLRAYLGEFAAGSDGLGRRALVDLLTELERNADVWIGWSAWAAGAWWPRDYIFRIGGAGAPNVFTQTLSTFARGAPVCDVQADDGAIDLDLARDRERTRPFLRTGRADRALVPWRDGAYRIAVPGQLRLGDFGLLIEQASANGMAAAHIGAVPGRGERPRLEPSELGSVVRLDAEAPSTRFDAAPEYGAARRDGFTAFSVSVRGHSGSLALRAGVVGAEIDLADHSVAVSAMACWATVTPCGEWRRVSLIWPARNSTPYISVTVHVAPREPVLLAMPSIERSTSSTTFAASRREADVVTLSGSLEALIRSEEFTILIETRLVTPASAAVPLLSAGSKLLLGRDAEGALQSDACATRSAPTPLDGWWNKRRCVLSVSKSARTAILATAGVEPVSGEFRPYGGDAPFRLGGIGDDALNGFITRIVAIPRAIGAQEAAGMAR